MAANVPVPVFRLSGANALVTFLYVFVLFGALHLLATAYPTSKLSQAFFALGF